MPDRYSILLEAAYKSYLGTLITTPAGSKNAKPILPESQLNKIDAVTLGEVPSLKSTLSECGTIVSNAQNKNYSSQSDFEQDYKKYSRLLKLQVEAFNNLFSSFSRDYNAWIKRGATLDWSARKNVVIKQQAQDATFKDGVANIQKEFDSDALGIIKNWPGSEDSGGSDDSGGKDKPDDQLIEFLDLTAQREALLDASLNGVPLVAIDPLLINPLTKVS